MTTVDFIQLKGCQRNQHNLFISRPSQAEFSRGIIEDFNNSLSEIPSLNVLHGAIKHFGLSSCVALRS